MVFPLRASGSSAVGCPNLAVFVRISAPMVFKNLPIEIDARGQARLRAEIGTAPFGVVSVAKPADASSEHDLLMQEAIQRSNVRFFEIEPLTRSSSRPSLRAVLDLEHHLVLDARVE